MGCGGNGAATLHLEDAAACTSTWRRLTTPQPFDSTSALVYAGGTLYYSSFIHQAVMAVPTDGSAPSVLAAIPTWELWVEGDHLLFSGASQSNQIFSLPLTGGTPQLVVDGGAGRSSPGLAMVHVFTSTDFFWIEQAGVDGTASPSTVWHQARSGGAPEQLATTIFTDPGPGGFYFPGTALALGSTTVVVGSAFGEAAAVPVGGGSSTPLATPAATANLNVESSLAGIDATGVYWSVPGPGIQPGSLMLSPADGSAAQQFGPTLPGNRSDGLVRRMWPLPEGGWVVTSLQIFSDGIDHMTLSLVDAQGNTTRLGCSPGAASDAWIEKGVAVAPDAVYVPAENLSADTWEIDRIAR